MTRITHDDHGRAGTWAPAVRPGPPLLGDAPALHFEQLTDRQRAGASCCWCAADPDVRFPVRILSGSGVRLRACALCAGLYGVPGETPS